MNFQSMVPLLVMKIFFYIAHVALDLLRRKLLLSSVLKIQSFRSKNYMTSLLIMKSFYAMLTQHYNQLRLLSTIPVLIPKLTPNLNSDLTLATIKNQLPHNKLAFFWPPPPITFNTLASHQLQILLLLLHLNPLFVSFVGNEVMMLVNASNLWPSYPIVNHMTTSTPNNDNWIVWL